MYITLKKLQRGPALKLIFSIVSTGVSGATTDVISVDNSAFIRFKFVTSHEDFTLVPSFTMKSISTNPLLKMTMRVTCENFDIEKLCADNFEDYTAMESKLFDVYFDAENRVVYLCILVVTVEVKTTFLPPHASRLSRLVGLRDVEDFHLKTADGAVGVQRATLIPHSEVFRAILRDNSETEWQFTDPSVTVGTLENLKRYIYFKILPEERSCRELLLAANNCGMERLKADCILKLVETVFAEDLDGLIKFAIDNNIPELVRAMIFRSSDDVVNRAYEMREQNREISNNVQYNDEQAENVRANFLSKVKQGTSTE